MVTAPSAHPAPGSTLPNPAPWGGTGRIRPGELVLAAAVLVCFLLILTGPALPADRTLMSLDGPLAMGPWQQADPGLTGHPRNPHLGDQDFLYYPYLRLIGRELAERGELPLWNPLLFGGVPLAGNAQFPLLYPGHLPLWLSQVGGEGFDARAFDRAFLWHALVRLVLCLLGAWLWFRRLGASWLAALLGATILGVGGYMVVWLQFTPAQVFCFIPLALFFLESWLQGRSGWHLVGYALCLGSSNLGGYVQTSFFFSLFILVYAVVRLWGMWEQSGFVLPRVVGFAVASLAAGLVAMPSVLPFMEYLDHSMLKGMRAGDRIWPEGVSAVRLVGGLAAGLGLGFTAWMVMRIGRMWAAVLAGLCGAAALLILDDPGLGGDGQLLHLVLPSAWGSPERGTWQVPAGLPNAVEVNADFIGVGGLLLVLLTPWVVGRGRRRLLPLVLLGVAGLTWAYGAHFPLLHQLGRKVLYIAQASRAAVLFPLAGAALAVYTLDRLVTMTAAERRRLLRPLAALGAGVVLVGAVVLGGVAGWGDALGLPAGWLGRVVAMGTPFGKDVTLVVSTFACLVWLLRAQRPHLPAAALVGLVAVNLLSTGHNFNTATPLDKVYPPTPALTWLQARDREARAEGRPFRVLGGRMMLRPNILPVFGLADVRGHDCFDPARYILMFRSMATTDNPALVDHRTLAMGARYFDLLGVRYYCTPEKWQAPAGWKEVARIAGTGIYENLDVLPRCYLVPGSLHIHHRDAAGRDPFRSPEVDPARQVFLEDAADRLPGKPYTSGRARMVEDAPNRVRIETQADGWSWLVLMDNYYPGWEAHLETGEPLAIRSAYYTWRTVPVPPGKHTVTFTYNPASWRWGLRLALLGLAIMAALGAWATRRRWTGNLSRI